MAYAFPPPLDEFVKRQMAAGDYASEDELLLDALKALAQHNEDLAAIGAGIDDLEAGRVRPLEAVADEIRHKHGFSADG